MPRMTCQGISAKLEQYVTNQIAVAEIIVDLLQVIEYNICSRHTLKLWSMLMNHVGVVVNSALVQSISNLEKLLKSDAVVYHGPLEDGILPTFIAIVEEKEW